VELQTNKIRETLKKERKKVGILVALLAVFLYVWIPLMKSSDSDMPVIPVSPAAAAQVAAGAGSSVEAAQPKEAPPYPAFLKVPLPARMLPRNPFVQLSAGAEKKKAPIEKKNVVPIESPSELLRKDEMRKAESMVVTSIMRSGSNPCCVVDGVVLSVGSIHKGFVIKEIREQVILFSGKAGDYTISVKQPIKFAPQKDDK
jgi:hypothetical protein